MRPPLAAAFLLLLGMHTAAVAVSGTVNLRLIALNDFHGHIEAAPSLATAIRALGRGHAHVVVVGAGDLVGASPLPSAIFDDRPAVRALSDAGLELSAAGNHEFDHGLEGLLDLQDGARFRWLAGNVLDAATGKGILPAYEVRDYDGIRVAFVGAVLRSTPRLAVASATKGLEFRDEAASVNALVPRLRAAGVEAIVLLVHEGGHLPGRYQDPACPGFEGPVVDIVRRLDPAIDVVVSGHTHEAYACRVDGRLVTSALPYGRMVAVIDVKLDRATGDVSRAKARLVKVDPARFPPDRKIESYVNAVFASVAPLVQREIGVMQGDNLGRIVADAQLEAMRGAGAQIAFVDAGGLRAPLPAGTNGPVTYGELHAMQPFRNALVAMTLTGAQLERLLEQQWRMKAAPDHPRLLSTSRGFEYRWDASRRAGHRVIAGSMRLDGREIAPERRYRVVVNSFIAEGGGGYTVLREGTDREPGPLDIEALERYVGRPCSSNSRPVWLPGPSANSGGTSRNAPESQLLVHAPGATAWIPEKAPPCRASTSRCCSPTESSRSSTPGPANSSSGMARR